MLHRCLPLPVSAMSHAKIRTILPFLLALCLVLLSACQPATRPAHEARPPLLVLVSIDGFRADYLERELTPTLWQLAQSGVHVEAMRPSFPSLTFPNHYSLVTGLVPDHHGIVHNMMRDPEIDGQRFTLSNREAVGNRQWWDGGQPIWNTARTAGLRSATMFWPGSEAPVRGHHPHYWLPFDMSLSPTARVQQVLEWIDLPAGQRPDFITLYFDHVDHDGHVHGPDSDQVRAAVASSDAAVARLVAGLRERGIWEDINLIVLSDHGMAATPPEQIIRLDEHVPRKLFRMITAGPLAGLEPREGREAELEAALSQPIPHVQCWHKTRMPERFRYGSHRRVPTWQCLGDEGWTIYDSAILKQHTPNPGAHGFDPALASMASLFVAHGPDFAPGARVADFDNVDVYPLLARLLRITPEAHDGDPTSTLPLMREGRDFSPARY